MRLSTDRLRLLLEVKRQGSMAAAAEVVSLTPSAVSQQIRRLELEVGLTLLERFPRGVALTEAGRVVAEHAAVIERQLSALSAVVDDIAGLRTGTLRLGTFPTFGASLLPYAVTRFRDLYPDVRLTVKSGRREQLLELLDRREVDLAMLWDYAWSTVDSTQLELLHVMDDPTTVVVSNTHPLAGRRSVSMHELAGENWIIRAEQHPVAEVLSRTAHAAGFVPTVSFEANDYQEAQAMVAVGLGVALAPRLALSNKRNDVTVLFLEPDEVPKRRILVASIKARNLSPSASAMRTILAELKGPKADIE